MPGPTRRSLALLFVVALLVARSPSAARAEEKPVATAVAFATAPSLDGDILSDPVWQIAPPTSGFRQTRPDAGEPASERTEIRVGYTASTLFVGIVLFDREPGAIIVSDSRRDASLDDTDSVRFIIDAFRDGQNGYVFGTNPAGIEYDGQLVNEVSGATVGGGGGGGPGGGGGGRFRRGSGGGFNLNWDGTWQVATGIDDYGWTAEFAIPFATLRYPARAGAQTWGLNVQRNIRRRNETAFWSRLEQQFGLYRLADAGTLTGIEAPRQRNLKLIPYAKVTGRRPPSGAGSIDEEADIGIDIKYGLTPSLTLDATFNTDFAEVEVDEQQVNLDRFTLFFPEKRPFFLENAGLFSVGATSEAEVFFSRRIGISENGDPIPIEAGARVTGKIGRTNVGVIGMLTDDLATDEEVFAADEFGVVRVNRELPKRSNVGFIIVHRDSRGAFETPDDENRTVAIDGKVGIGEYQNIEGWIAQTTTPGIDADDHAYQAEWSLGGPLWSADLGYLEVGGGFNPEVGFLSRKDFRKPSGRIQRRIRPHQLWGLLELRPHMSYNGYWDFDGFKESEFLHIDNAWEWRNGTTASTAINFTYEGVKEAFEISPGVVVPPGEYDHTEGLVFFGTNRGAPLSLFVRATVGGFFGGDRVSIAPSVRLRRSEILTSEITWDYNNVKLPFGDFEVNLGRLRLSYSPTPKLLLQLLSQYNDRDDDISTNLRFSWLRTANTGLFIVYNEIDELGSNPLDQRSDRSLIVKYSHQLDVFGR